MTNHTDQHGGSEHAPTVTMSGVRWTGEDAEIVGNLRTADREVLATVIANHPRPVSAEEVARAIWGEQAESRNRNGVRTLVAAAAASLNFLTGAELLTLARESSTAADTFTAREAEPVEPVEPVRQADVAVSALPVLDKLQDAAVDVPAEWVSLPRDVLDAFDTLRTWFRGDHPEGAPAEAEPEADAVPVTVTPAPECPTWARRRHAESGDPGDPIEAFWRDTLAARDRSGPASLAHARRMVQEHSARVARRVTLFGEDAPETNFSRLLRAFFTATLVDSLRERA